METWGWVLIITNLVVLAVAIHFKNYLKKKAELLATNENFNNLKKQLKDTTNLTKKIEAKLNNDAWVEQQRWTIRKDFYIEATSLLSQAYIELRESSQIYQETLKLEAEMSDTNTEKLKNNAKRFEELSALTMIKTNRLGSIVNEVGVLFLDANVLAACNIYLGAEAKRVKALTDSIFNQNSYHKSMQIDEEINNLNSFLDNELKNCNIARELLVDVAREDLKIAWDNKKTK